MDGVKATEAASAAVVVSPDTRVKLADIEAAIAHEATFVLGNALQRLGHDGAIQDATDTYTVHVVVMRNGFIVVGKSAPADPANFNAELGARFAREDCIRQLWPLMAFSLRDKLSQA